MHIKYRPKTWNEVIGNTAIKKSLMNLNYNRPILLQGERGCGKTTLAYIIAKDFGANDYTVRDYNCGQDTDKAGIGQRMEGLHRSTIYGNKQALILDEIHLLSGPAKTALLKPTESESLPENSLIIACTTEPEKLPLPLYERFLSYQVKPLNAIESLELLNKVIKGEGISITKSLKVLIVDKSEGIPRRILTGLARVQGTEDEDEAAYLLDIIAFNDEAEVMDIFKTLIAPSVSFASTKKMLKLALKKRSPDSIRVGLMNILSGRIMSDWFKASEYDASLNLYESLRQAQGYPEKANLIIAIMKGKY